MAIYEWFWLLLCDVGGDNAQAAGDHGHQRAGANVQETTSPDQPRNLFGQWKSLGTKHNRAFQSRAKAGRGTGLVWNMCHVSRAGDLGSCQKSLPL
jgi:hypothetical protein